MTGAGGETGGVTRWQMTASPCPVPICIRFPHDLHWRLKLGGCSAPQWERAQARRKQPAAAECLRRFGAALNAHVHLHLCILDGVVAQGRQGLAFRGAQVDEACVKRVQVLVRQRVLRLFERRGLLIREMVAVMQGWGHSGGFGVHAGVRVAAQDRAGRARLLRYCARPMFAGERLVWAGGRAQVRCRVRRCRGTGLSSSSNKDLLNCA